MHAHQPEPEPRPPLPRELNGERPFQNVVAVDREERAERRRRQVDRHVERADDAVVAVGEQVLDVVERAEDEDVCRGIGGAGGELWARAMVGGVRVCGAAVPLPSHAPLLMRMVSCVMHSCSSLRVAITMPCFERSATRDWS